MTARHAQRAVDALVLGALVALVASAYVTWTVADPGDVRPSVRLDGREVTGGPVALALAALGAAVVLRLAGTAARRALAVVLVLLGAAAIWIAVTERPGGAELADLRPELGPVVTDHVDAGTGPAPWLAGAGGVLLVAAGVLGAVTAGGWRRASSRYERRPGPGPEQVRQDPWKAIDAGEDPTV